MRRDPARGGPGLLLRGLVARATGDPWRVREQYRAGEPSGVQDLAGAVVLAQQRGAEQGVAQHRQRQGRDRGVDRRAVHRGAPEVQHEHHAHQHDVQQRIGQRQRALRHAAALEMRGVGEREAP
ncbi:putative alpha/beta hydrolase [Streptomyces sioyaensis]|uniref:putative alpha/beta hydrolase n=1 Tax=Streptomyces sioyaensis TaxID=67364 RepID=UPI0037A92C5B